MQITLQKEKEEESGLPQEVERQKIGGSLQEEPVRPRQSGKEGRHGYGQQDTTPAPSTLSCALEPSFQSLCLVCLSFINIFFEILLRAKPSAWQAYLLNPERSKEWIDGWVNR